MSRSGYVECYGEDAQERWQMIRWRGAVQSAINGKRGQAFLKLALSVLQSMDKKELCANSFASDGQFCLLGVVANHQGVDVSDLFEFYCEYRDNGDHAIELAEQLNIAPALALEIAFKNDDEQIGSDADRFRVIYSWIESNLNEHKMLE